MARRFGRRRRPKVVWLPNTGTNFGDTAGASPSFISFVTDITCGIGNNPTIEAPMVIDNDKKWGTGTIAAYEADSLANVQSFGYRLRRIVGNFTVSLAPARQLDGSLLVAPAAIAVTAAFIIRRVDEDGNAVASGLGSSANSLANIGDPWIWRRTWILTPYLTSIEAGTTTLFPTPPADTPLLNHIQELPSTTGFHTGQNLTSSVDQKTARIVGAEERLFMDLTFRSVDTRDVGDKFCNVFLFFDYRVLASLRTGTGNRRNAVR